MLSQNSPLRVQIKDYPFDPRQKGPSVVESKTVDGRLMYHVYIRLEGIDLPLVKAVYYFLDSSVQPSHVTVVKDFDNPNCMVDLWLWGKFTMSATVLDVRGSETQLSYTLEFGNYFEPDTFKDMNLSVRSFS